jgi:hypothetical protein
MKAEERIQKIREHLEVAYGHEMFSVEELENSEETVEIKISKYYTDETRKKRLKFHNGKIVGVWDKDE